MTDIALEEKRKHWLDDHFLWPTVTPCERQSRVPGLGGDLRSTRSRQEVQAKRGAGDGR